MTDFVRVYLSGNPVHDRVLRAFADGIPGANLIEGWEYEPSSVAVIFGVYKSKVPLSYPRGEVFQRQRKKNLDVVVLETGYINRGDGETHHYAAGFNGLNGRADFRNDGSPPDRAMKLGVELKPYHDGDYIVLCSQVPWDASVDGTDHARWVHETAEQVRHFSFRPIKFRPHPMARGVIPVPKDCELSEVPLSEDLKNAHAVLAFNSNSGVEALLDGVASFAFDRGSMAWRMSNRSLLSIDFPSRPDRSQWLNNLCYAQWTIDEMRCGEAWAHLSKG